ncbi:MAG: hypothetical protein GW856_13050 [Cyanobacteria bacterium]|nr:hypothetical protein [Cyanobacteria bacterium CG_2015-16_32_12]NCO78617.1 hypothetical protein [Cyanobacteria bacterium CG_2015-22_32_23]NCQ03009.1 hypothetical protein [Cyanobacteria bacterium CG_2015-09_32_10]
MVALGEPGTPLIFWAIAGPYQIPGAATITVARKPISIGLRRSGNSGRNCANKFLIIS